MKKQQKTYYCINFRELYTLQVSFWVCFKYIFCYPYHHRNKMIACITTTTTSSIIFRFGSILNTWFQKGNTTFQDRNDFTSIIKCLSFEPYITLSILLGFWSRKFKKNTQIHEYGRKWKQRCWCYTTFEKRVSLFKDSHDGLRNLLSFNGKIVLAEYRRELVYTIQNFFVHSLQNLQRGIIICLPQH